MAPRLDGSAIFASCFQLGSCCTQGHDPQQNGRAFLIPPLLPAAGDLETWSGPWGRACVCVPFCSAPSVAQTKKRYREYVSPSQRPADTQQIPVWLGPAAFPSFTPKRPRVNAAASRSLVRVLTKHNPSQGRAGLLQSRLWHHVPSMPSSWLRSRKKQLPHCCSCNPPWRLLGFLKGQIFPLCSCFLGSCSSKPSLVSRLAFPQRRIISPSRPGQ